MKIPIRSSKRFLRDAEDLELKNFGSKLKTFRESKQVIVRTFGH